MLIAFCLTDVYKLTQPTPKFGTVNALLGGVHHAGVDPNTGDLYYAYGNRDAVTRGKMGLLIEADVLSALGAALARILPNLELQECFTAAGC